MQYDTPMLYPDLERLHGSGVLSSSPAGHLP